METMVVARAAEIASMAKTVARTKTLIFIAHAL
jgi:hypothetical protein